MVKVLVEISTKNRDPILGRCLAALHQQSYRDFDVLILNDGDEVVGKTQTTAYILGELGSSRNVWLERGSHISQAYNHNIALYPVERKADWIVRLDDDILLNRRAIEYMVETMQGDNVVAVGGLWFEDTWDSAEFHDRAAPEDLSHPWFSGEIGGVPMNWQQRVYHPEDKPYEVQHIYSACMYDVKAMRFVGGWPEVYSKGVAQGEETDGTYRLYLAGGKLLIDPRVTGQHLRSPGGIRSAAHLSKSEVMDLEKWRNRLDKLESINFFPTVAVEFVHDLDRNMADKLFYQTAHLLQSRTGLDVYPVFGALRHSPEECEKLFGFSYEEREPLDSYDVHITIGHGLMPTTNAKHKILYCLSPFEIEPQDRILLTEYDLILGVPGRATEHIRESWGYEPKWLYPPDSPERLVENITLPDECHYARQLEQYIRRVNAMALELVPVEREDISITPRIIRVAALSDSPRLTTGFAVPAAQIYNHIAAQPDMELCVFGLMDSNKLRPGEELPYAFYEAPFGDLQATSKGAKVLPDFIKWASWKDPIDVILEIYEPGHAYNHIMTMRSLGIDQPVILYFPIEGLPPHNLVYDLAGKVEYPVVFCKSGIDFVKRQVPQSPIEYAYLGIDHAPFAPLPPEERKKWRELVGWNDKFIILNVGTNKRGKQQPYLIDAMRILLEWGHDDVYMYLHTRRYDQNVMNGWNLEWIADRASFIHDLPVSDHILFPPDYDKWRGMPYHHTEPVEEWKLVTPATPQARGAIFTLMDMITMYGISDLCVDVSSVEGWGLPVLESVACGLPTISVDDGHVRSEVHYRYCWDMLRPKHWDMWHTSATLQLVDPEDVARAIITAKDNYGAAKAQALKASKQVMQDLPWATTTQYFVDLIRKAAYGRA